MSPDELENRGYTFEAAGARCFQQIPNKIHLSENVRQKTDPEFFKLLENVKKREVSDQDYTILQSRFMENLSSTDIVKFKDASALFPYRAQVDVYNR